MLLPHRSLGGLGAELDSGLSWDSNRGVFALVLWWQFMCRSLSAAVDACVTGFIKARDETSISRARLLCLQVRQNLEVVR